MSGFFGVIHADRGEWRCHNLVPHPAEAVRLIQLYRDLMARSEPLPGNGPVVLDAGFYHYGIPEDDIAVLCLMVGHVFSPSTPEFQMIAATAIAILHNAPCFYVEGVSFGEQHFCELYVIQTQTPREAHVVFSEQCSDRFLT
jgi:hypothetical protein